MREKIRGVEGLQIPSEKRMIQCKQSLALTHDTQTATFANGAYLTDPFGFVCYVSVQSPFIAVGGDAGGGHTKLGITYSVQGVQTFAALLVYDGTDSWEDLNKLKTPSLTPFTGDSAAFSNIFAVLQHLIDNHKALLNGDWPFINGLLGLMAPSATHPCPICIVSHNNFLRTSRYRTPADKHSKHPDQPALLTIPPERIVPTPLHLFLGISNRIILDVYTELLGESQVLAAVQRIKSTHSAGCGGLSDIHQLNGPEISKWIKKESSSSLLAAASASTSIAAATKATFSILSRWLQQLHGSLLHSRDWTVGDLDAWRCMVSDIHQNWRTETCSDAFPKLHMLHHTIDFAERHRFLGRASEAQIESFHATFNALFHIQHRNKSSNIVERLRRSLADASLRAVQPFIKQ